jgi:hypothetical protein
MNKVFYIPGTANAIDYARPTADGQFLSYWQGRTLEQLREEYPGVILCDEAEFIALQAKALTTQPEQITEREYIDALEVLPPLHWHRQGGASSFKFVEFYAGNITWIFVHIGSQHWKFRGDADLSHDDIVQRVRCAEN